MKRRRTVFCSRQSSGSKGLERSVRRRRRKWRCKRGKTTRRQRRILGPRRWRSMGCCSCSAGMCPHLLMCKSQMALTFFLCVTLIGVNEYRGALNLGGAGYPTWFITLREHKQTPLN